MADSATLRVVDGGRFGRPAECSTDAGDVLATPILQGLEMPLGRIFAA